MKNLLSAACVGLTLLSAEAPAQGTVTSVSGVGTTALRFDGGDDLVHVPDDVSLDGLSEMTVEFWLRAGIQAPSGGAIISKWQTQSGSSLDDAWCVSIGDSPGVGAPEGVILFAINGLPAVVGSTRVDDGEWRHVAITWSPPEVRLYLDGQLDSTGSMASAMNATTAPVRLGAHSKTATFDPYWFLDGELDLVRVWNVARGEQQLSNARCRVLPQGTPGLVGQWAMEGQGQAVVDSSGSGNDGVLGLDANPGGEAADPARVRAALPCPLGTPLQRPIGDTDDVIIDQASLSVETVVGAVSHGEFVPGRFNTAVFVTAGGVYCRLYVIHGDPTLPDVIMSLGCPPEYSCLDDGASIKVSDWYDADGARVLIRPNLPLDRFFYFKSLVPGFSEIFLQGTSEFPQVRRMYGPSTMRFHNGIAYIVYACGDPTAGPGQDNVLWRLLKIYPDGSTEFVDLATVLHGEDCGATCHAGVLTTSNGPDGEVFLWTYPGGYWGFNSWIGVRYFVLPGGDTNPNASGYYTGLFSEDGFAPSGWTGILEHPFFASDGTNLYYVGANYGSDDIRVMELVRESNCPTGFCGFPDTSPDWSNEPMTDLALLPHTQIGPVVGPITFTDSHPIHDVEAMRGQGKRVDLWIRPAGIPNGHSGDISNTFATLSVVDPSSGGSYGVDDVRQLEDVPEHVFAGTPWTLQMAGIYSIKETKSSLSGSQGFVAGFFYTRLLHSQDPTLPNAQVRMHAD